MNFVSAICVIYLFVLAFVLYFLKILAFWLLYDWLLCFRCWIYVIFSKIWDLFMQLLFYISLCWLVCSEFVKSSAFRLLNGLVDCVLHVGFMWFLMGLLWNLKFVSAIVMYFSVSSVWVCLCSICLSKVIRWVGFC